MTNIELLYEFATLMILGGIFGYVKGRSKVSLIAGLGSGALLTVAALLPFTAGRWLALAVAAILAVVFTMRWVKTRSFMPSGLLLLVTIAFIVLFLLNSIPCI